MCPFLLGSQLRVAKSDDQSKPSTESVNPALMPEPLKERVAAPTHTCLLWPFTVNPVHGHQPATGMPVSSTADLHTAHNQSHQTLYTCQQPGLMPLSPRTLMAILAKLQLGSSGGWVAMLSGRSSQNALSGRSSPRHPTHGEPQWCRSPHQEQGSSRHTSSTLTAILLGSPHCYHQHNFTVLAVTRSDQPL